MEIGLHLSACNKLYLVAFWRLLAVHPKAFVNPQTPIQLTVVALNYANQSNWTFRVAPSGLSEGDSTRTVKPHEDVSTRKLTRFTF